jgi:hypothetical protein
LVIAVTARNREARQAAEARLARYRSTAQEISRRPVPPAVVPGPARVATTWDAEFAFVNQRFADSVWSRVTLAAPPLKAHLLGKTLTMGIGLVTGDSVNEVALDEMMDAEDAADSLRLPDTCVFCGLLPGEETRKTDLSVDVSTLGYFLGGEVLSQQRIVLFLKLCRKCAAAKKVPSGLFIERYGKLGEVWSIALRVLNDRVADEIRALNGPSLIDALACETCQFNDTDENWLAREDVCPVCSTILAGCSTLKWPRFAPADSSDRRNTATVMARDGSPVSERWCGSGRALACRCCVTRIVRRR